MRTSKFPAALLQSVEGSRLLQLLDLGRGLCSWTCEALSISPVWSTGWQLDRTSQKQSKRKQTSKKTPRKKPAICRMDKMSRLCSRKCPQLWLIYREGSFLFESLIFLGVSSLLTCWRSYQRLRFLISVSTFRCRFLPGVFVGKLLDHPLL